MSWIKTIAYDKSKGKLQSVYNRVKGPNESIDNVLMLHSLRPHTLIGHMTLYKSVLHHSGNTLPKWFLEALGVYISNLNYCSYCVDHHFVGLQRAIGDNKKARQFLEAIEENRAESFFGLPFDAGFVYSKKLTLGVQDIKKEDFKKLKASGFSDGEILEINQLTSYFNYVNRSVLGLGITTEGDILGLSPNENDKPESWEHS